MPTYLGAMQLGGMLGYSPLLMSNMGQALTINGLTDHSRYVFRPSHLRQVRVSPVSYAKFVFGTCFASPLRQVRVSPVSYARFVFRQSFTPRFVFRQSVTPGSCLASQFFKRVCFSPVKSSSLFSQVRVSPGNSSRFVFR